MPNRVALLITTGVVVRPQASLRRSQPAIACREYGLPAVRGTGFATSMITTGQMIRVDGSSGTVTILD